MTKGMFIVFEGLDGSGSSTQVSLLQKALRKAGYTAHITKEPTNNLIGGLIRGQLTKDWKTGPECLQLLFAADRAHHLEREILPGVEKGCVVISDRYYFSTMAFGGIDIDMDWLKKLNEKFKVPDLSFFIKVPARECVKRISDSRFEFELFEEEKKLERVWKNYDILAKDFDNVHVIDGTQSVEEVHEEILAITLDKLRVKGSMNMNLNAFVKKK
ncbi:MAG: dTMP kinase [Candidatus Aenigmarchaeota archaeon]|nr:dTMP kinase [Candidatus Aenigmarchaeota archaeon]